MTVAPTSPVTPVRSPDLGTVLVALADLGPPSELRAQGPEVLAGAFGFDRVLLTNVNSGMLEVEAVYVARGAPFEVAIADLGAVALKYPLVEGEIMRRRRAQIVGRSPRDPPGMHAFSELFGSSAYVIVPIMLDGRVIGFFHADRQCSGSTVTEAEIPALSTFASCFALVYERAALRLRLRAQRQEMLQVATWADARTRELGDRAIGLADDTAPETNVSMQPTGDFGERALRDLLTRREVDVLALMARGGTNGAIAKDLVISEGTVKFHVKNILRKLHASNRAEATSRYLRLTLKSPERLSGRTR
jgi:DNA-binding CsgD family transcriptional regulator